MMDGLHWYLLVGMVLGFIVTCPRDWLGGSTSEEEARLAAEKLQREPRLKMGLFLSLAVMWLPALLLLAMTLGARSLKSLRGGK